MGATAIDARTKLEVIGILTELENLQGLDFPRKNAAVELADLVASQSDEAIDKCYCSFRWWGGSGSMADYLPKSDRLTYTMLLIRLFRAFESAGFKCPGAGKWVTILQMWVDKVLISN